LLSTGETMKEENAQEIMQKFSTLKIGVLGDFAVDAYWMLEDSVGEISVETGKRAFVVRSQRYSLGGAGNIATNLAALDLGGVEAFGVIGEDLFSKLLVSRLEALGIETSGMILQREKWDTPVWAKPHLGDEEQRRLDFGFYNELAEETRERLFDKLTQRLGELDALIVNQQLPRPLISASLIGKVNSLAGRFRDKVLVVDSRENIGDYQGMILKFNGESLIKMRRGVETLEAEDSIGRDEIVEALEALFSSYGKPVIITRGKRGCLIYERGRIDEVPGVMVTGPVDPVGAGDTMLAALTAALAAGVDIRDAAMLGNFAASVTVSKLRQTGTATQAEIMARVAEGSLIYRAELAEDPRGARYLEGTRIEIVDPQITRGQIRQVLFDHDGTVSTLRQGWEPIMEKVMLESIFGPAYQTVSMAEFRKVQDRVREFIDQTTGIQTILQMQGLVEMVREFGYVPEDKILDSHGYKAVFNKELMKMVNRRLESLKAGELDLEDFTVKGAVKFVRSLKDAGMRLYLASGTDQEDTEKEAARLDYASLFDGGIFGSVGDITKFSKKKLIAEIIEGHKLEGPQLCTFGDGPVEIRETKRRGGIAVGVASDEVRRYGLNPSKRERLVKAGADIIVADFTEGAKLFDYLMGKR